MNWNATLPIPKTDAERYPEVKALGARFHDRATLRTEKMLEGFRMEIAPERPDEFAPGLDPALRELVQQAAEMELAEADDPGR